MGQTIIHRHARHTEHAFETLYLPLEACSFPRRRSSFTCAFLYEFLASFAMSRGRSQQRFAPSLRRMRAGRLGDAMISLAGHG